MNCQLCRIEIEELDLGDGLSEAARSHIDACLPCGAFYHERLSLRKLVGSLDPVSAPADFEFRLRARLASADNAGNHRFSLRSFIASAPAIGLAASFALLVAAVVIYNQSGTRPAANQPLAAIDEKSGRESQPASSPTSSAIPTATPNESVGDNAKAGSILGTDAGSYPRQSVAGNNRNNRRVKQSEAIVPEIETHDEAVRPAPQIRPALGAQFVAASTNPLVELPVRSSAQPMRVFVNDSSGARRSVTLEPVIFGSQDLTGRVGFRPVSSQGIW